MENLSKLFNSLDGNIVEYCILGGIIVLVVILIISIISCIKSLGEKSVSKIKKNSIKLCEEESEDKFDKDYIAELIDVAEGIKKNDEEILIETKEEIKIAEKIDIPEVIEKAPELILDEAPVRVAQKLDIKSITREMELKLEEEDINEIEAYEDEQEKTAIISYKELLQAASKIEEQALLEEKLDDVDVDLDVVFEFNSKKIIEQDQEVDTKSVYNSGELIKFKPTIDISPVFGPLRSDRYKSQDELLKIEEIELDDSSDIGEREEFLKNLHDFRSNLD